MLIKMFKDGRERFKGIYTLDVLKRELTQVGGILEEEEDYSEISIKCIKGDILLVDKINCLLRYLLKHTNIKLSLSIYNSNFIEFKAIGKLLDIIGVLMIIEEINLNKDFDSLVESDFKVITNLMTDTYVSYSSLSSSYIFHNLGEYIIEPSSSEEYLIRGLSSMPSSEKEKLLKEEFEKCYGITYDEYKEGNFEIPYDKLDIRNIDDRLSKSILNEILVKLE